MKYVIKKRCLFKINTFYRNVSRKYKHTYSEELMHKNADEAIDTMYQIELTLLRRKPTINCKDKHFFRTNKLLLLFSTDFLKKMEDSRN